MKAGNMISSLLWDEKGDFLSFCPTSVLHYKEHFINRKHWSEITSPLLWTQFSNQQWILAWLQFHGWLHCSVLCGMLCRKVKALTVNTCRIVNPDSSGPSRRTNLHHCSVYPYKATYVITSGSLIWKFLSSSSIWSPLLTDGRRGLGSSQTCNQPCQ